MHALMVRDLSESAFTVTVVAAAIAKTHAADMVRSFMIVLRKTGSRRNRFRLRT
jgi:hypothetical protein